MDALFPLTEVVSIAIFLGAVVFLLVFGIWNSPFHRRSDPSHRLFTARERLRYARRH
jgi:hypothetical protein